MKEKRIMEGLIDKRHLGAIFKMDKGRVAGTPNLEKLKRWTREELDAKNIDLNAEVLVCYDLTQWLGFNENFAVETPQVKVFTAEHILKLQFAEVLQKA